MAESVSRFGILKDLYDKIDSVIQAQEQLELDHAKTVKRITKRIKELEAKMSFDAEKNFEAWKAEQLEKIEERKAHLEKNIAELTAGFEKFKEQVLAKIKEEENRLDEKTEAYLKQLDDEIKSLKEELAQEEKDYEFQKRTLQTRLTELKDAVKQLQEISKDGGGRE